MKKTKLVPYSEWLNESSSVSFNTESYIFCLKDVPANMVDWINEEILSLPGIDPMTIGFEKGKIRIVSDKSQDGKFRRSRIFWLTPGINDDDNSLRLWVSYDADTNDADNFDSLYNSKFKQIASEISQMDHTMDTIIEKMNSKKAKYMLASGKLNI